MSDQSTPHQADKSPSNQSTHADRLRAMLQRARLSQRAAARLLEIDERTMRQWCAGQGIPPESVFRALSPKLTHVEHLRQRIEENEKIIEAFQNGDFKVVPRAYQPASAEAANKEIEHLRRCNEEHRSLVRLEEAIDWQREAHAVVFQQWEPHGSGAPTEESLDELDAAEKEFSSAKAEVDRITADRRAQWWR